MSEYKIQVKNLHKAFGKKVVLDGVDIEIKKGESLVVIGGSGTGKSVLIKCIQGLLNPDEGSIKVDGVEINGADETVRDAMHAKMGMLFQGGALFDSLSVWENVAFGLIENQKWNRKDAKKRSCPCLAAGRSGSRRGRFVAERTFRRYAETRQSGPGDCHQTGNHLF